MTMEHLGQTISMNTAQTMYEIGKVEGIAKAKCDAVTEGIAQAETHADAEAIAEVKAKIKAIHKKYKLIIARIMLDARVSVENVKSITKLKKKEVKSLKKKHSNKEKNV
jgi:formaldehyde-activating enzyme involved in methanogenesis